MAEPDECLQNNCGCAMQLLERGRTVVAAARDEAKASEVFSELGLCEGMNGGSGKVSMHLLHSWDVQGLAEAAGVPSH